MVRGELQTPVGRSLQSPRLCLTIEFPVLLTDMILNEKLGLAVVQPTTSTTSS